MNFLQLCQRTVLESGISDSGPSAVSGQKGDMLRIVNWVSNAWLDLQSSRNQWQWMRNKTSIEVKKDNPALVLPAQVKNLIESTVYLDDLSLFKSIPPIGNGSPLTGRPQSYYYELDGSIRLNTSPDQDYTLTFWYDAKPVGFVEGIEEPYLPSEYHMIIVWAALKEYAVFDEAPELYQKGESNFQMLLARLERNTLPALELAGPLA